MDAAADAAEWGGYRDVALNLRVDTAATRRAGVEAHVCELQLILGSILAHKVCTHAHDRVYARTRARTHPRMHAHAAGWSRCTRSERRRDGHGTEMPGAA